MNEKMSENTRLTGLGSYCLGEGRLCSRWQQQDPDWGPDVTDQHKQGCLFYKGVPCGTATTVFSQLHTINVATAFYTEGENILQ